MRPLALLGLALLGATTLACTSSSAPRSAASATAVASPITVPLDVTHTSSFQDQLVVAGSDGRGHACVHAVDLASARSRSMYCEAGLSVRGLASSGRGALVILGPITEPFVDGRLLEAQDPSLGVPPRLLASGPLDGPMAVHDGGVHAVQGENVLAVSILPGGPPPTLLAEQIYAETTQLFWHRDQLFGQRGEALITRAKGDRRRPVSALRWQAFTSDRGHLFGLSHHQGDGTTALESWASNEPRSTRLAKVPGGDTYAIAVTERSIVVASGRLITELRRAEGRLMPTWTLPGSGSVRLQEVGGKAVFAVTQDVLCAGRGTMRSSGKPARPAAPCKPVARVVRVSTGE